MIKFLDAFKGFLVLSLLLVSIISCSEDDDAQAFSIEDYSIKNLNVQDIGNNGDASDIRVSFEGALATSIIQEYRLIVVGSSATSTFSLNVAESLDTQNYTTLTNDRSDFSTELSADQNDFEGNEIVQNTDYRVFVLTIGTLDGESVSLLSNESNTVNITEKSQTSTLVPNFKGNDAISIDADGNLYISNYGTYVDAGGGSGGGNGTAGFKVTPDGSVTEFVSNLSGPLGNAIDADGNFYVNNGNNNSSADLTKVAPDGTQTVIATISGYPSGLLLGTDGNFYVSNYLSSVVNKVTPDGTVSVFSSDSRLAGGVGIVYGNGGSIIVGNFTTGDILSISPSGSVSLIATIPTVAQNFVIGYITFFEDHIYATGYGSNKIYKVSLGGTITEFAGSGSLSSKNGDLLTASFITPNGIAVDKERRILYVTENGSGGGLRVIPLD